MNALRPHYRRADFAAPLERGKFYEEAVKGVRVVLLTPRVAKAFPTSEAVNEALEALLAFTEQIARNRRRAARTVARQAARSPSI